MTRIVGSLAWTRFVSLGHCTFAPEFWRVGRPCRGQHHPPFMVGFPSPFQVEGGGFGSHVWHAQSVPGNSPVFCLARTAACTACTRMALSGGRCSTGFMQYSCAALLRVMAFALRLACHSLAFARSVALLGGQPHHKSHWYCKFWIFTRNLGGII